MLTTFLLLASTLVAAEMTPYKLGSISKNPNLGLARRQDAGYSPTQTYCGPGTDCASSCGATYITCASTDDALHCYDPSINESCCPDGTGSKLVNLNLYRITILTWELQTLAQMGTSAHRTQVEILGVAPM